MLEEMGGRDGVFEELLGGEVENFGKFGGGVYREGVCNGGRRGNKSDQDVSV